MVRGTREPGWGPGATAGGGRVGGGGPEPRAVNKQQLIINSLRNGSITYYRYFLLGITPQHSDSQPCTKPPLWEHEGTWGARVVGASPIDGWWATKNTQRICKHEDRSPKEVSRSDTSSLCAKNVFAERVTNDGLGQPTIHFKRASRSNFQCARFAGFRLRPLRANKSTSTSSPLLAGSLCSPFGVLCRCANTCLSTACALKMLRAFAHSSDFFASSRSATSSAVSSPCLW